MKKVMSKKDAEEKIDDFFKQKNLKAEDVKKIKRLSMKYKIRLGDRRKRFCKKCFADLKGGKVRVSKIYKGIECRRCGTINRWEIS